MSDIVIIGGCGHVGLPLGLAFADAGKRVVALDRDAKKVEATNSGKMPFIDEGADELLVKVLERETFRVHDRRRRHQRRGLRRHRHRHAARRAPQPAARRVSHARGRVRQLPAQGPVARPAQHGLPGHDDAWSRAACSTAGWTSTSRSVPSALRRGSRSRRSTRCRSSSRARHRARNIARRRSSAC